MGCESGGKWASSQSAVVQGAHDAKNQNKQGKGKKERSMVVEAKGRPVSGTRSPLHPRGPANPAGKLHSGQAGGQARKKRGGPRSVGAQWDQMDETAEPEKRERIGREEAVTRKTNRAPWREGGKRNETTNRKARKWSGNAQARRKAASKIEKADAEAKAARGRRGQTGRPQAGGRGSR